MTSAELVNFEHLQSFLNALRNINIQMQFKKQPHISILKWQKIKTVFLQINYCK